MVPRPGVLRTSTSPPCSCTIRWTSESPSPVPSALVEKKGSKTWARSSGAMPCPLSATDTSSLWPGTSVAPTRSSPPSGMASTALRQRFHSTCRNRCGSTRQTRGPENPRRILRPAAGARCSSRTRTPSSASATSTASTASGAGRAYSRKFVMIWLSRSDSRMTICDRRSRASPAAAVLVRTSMAPVSDASGLRISWAMLAASRPSVASLSAWRIRASIARIAERSSQAPISPSRSPSPERSAEKVRRTGTAVPVRLTFSALRSGEGDRLGLIGACDDLSAIRAMEARMRQADRLATLGRLAANIAHEIRNPLASLTGAIEVLTSTAAAGDARERLSQIVMRESERLNQIITNFLEYARPAPLAVEAVDVADALEGVLVLLEHRAPAAGLKILRGFSGPLVWRVDPQRFRQVLWNLCLNAVEAMPEGGELRVGATLVPGLKLEVSVADSGHGIAPDDLAHVFEPFFSTKADGTGLGLSLVHRIVQEHGGEVDVRSTPGLGTMFTVTLPARHA